MDLQPYGWKTEKRYGCIFPAVCSFASHTSPDAFLDVEYSILMSTRLSFETGKVISTFDPIYFTGSPTTMLSFWPVASSKTWWMLRSRESRSWNSNWWIVQDVPCTHGLGIGWLWFGCSTILAFWPATFANSHQPRQNWADNETLKFLKSTQPCLQANGMANTLDWLNQHHVQTHYWFRVRLHPFNWKDDWTIEDMIFKVDVEFKRHVCHSGLFNVSVRVWIYLHVLSKSTTEEKYEEWTPYWISHTWFKIQITAVTVTPSKDSC